MALLLEFTIIRASNTSQSHEQQARNRGPELDDEINGRAKWGFQTCIDTEDPNGTTLISAGPL